MKVKFIFKTKAHDGVMSEIDIERQELQKQADYWKDKVEELKNSGASKEKIRKAQDRVKAYDSKLNNSEDIKAEDMPVSNRQKDFLEPSTMNEVVADLKRFLRRDIPVMLMGYSGFGKSQLTKQAATSIPGYPVKPENVLDIRAGMMNVEDLRGIPMLVKDEDPEKAFTKNTIPPWLKKVLLNTDENFVLFFDEINHASAAVLNSLYGIILERTLEEFKFAERTRIVAAGNTADENEDLSELSTPLRNRLEIISIDKAVNNNPDFFEDYLRGPEKYQDRIPREMLEALFDEDEELGNARAIDILLNAWAEDIADGEDRLTKSGAIPAGLYAKIQKLYKQKYYKATGSQGHKETIKHITQFIDSLYDSSPELFPTDLIGYKVSDLINGEIKGEPFKGSSMKLGPEGERIVKEKFADVPEELLLAALDKIARG